MSIVADISVVLAWFFEESHTPAALHILKRAGKEGLLVPPLWWTELENGILMGERRARKKPAESQAFLNLIHGLMIETDDVPKYRISPDILDLSRKFNLTSYDGTYAELAQRRGVPLATFDVALRQCAARLKIKLLPS